MKGIFNITLADGKTKVPMIGHRVDEYFAWTPPADQNNGTGVCSVLTHIPTGVGVRMGVGSIGAAKRIAAAYQEKLKGVNWLTDSFEELHKVVNSKRNAKAVEELKHFDGKTEKQVRNLRTEKQVRNLHIAQPHERLAVVLGTKEWSGSEVDTKEENGELVHYLKHSSGAHMRLLAGVSRPCER